MNALWTAHAIAAATGGLATAAFAATGVSIDTRTLRSGDLFIALVGETGDGHAHAAEALACGAAGVLIHNPDAIAPGAPAVIVPDTLAALQALGGAGRTRFTGRVVAVTGSVGKTTTKEMLRTALAAFGPTHAAEASYNNHWGLPLTLARLPAGAAFCVCEIGMNHAGEILPLARLAAPHVGVITAIAPAHIGHLGSLAAIAAEKASLLRGVLPGGVAVLPGDSPFLPVLRDAAEGLAVAAFGTASLRDLQADAEGSGVVASIGGQHVAFRLAVPGRHMAENAVAALTVIDALGLDLIRAASALEAFRSMTGRGAQRPILGGRALLLDESYNASSASVRAALSVLALLPATRRVAVLGDMLELGDHARDEHLGLAGDVSRIADRVFACGPLMRVLFDAVPNRIQGAHADDAASLAPVVARAVAPGDAVLVKGSLGSRMKQIVRALDEVVP